MLNKKLVYWGTKIGCDWTVATRVSRRVMYTKDKEFASDIFHMLREQGKEYGISNVTKENFYKPEKK